MSIISFIILQERFFVKMYFSSLSLSLLLIIVLSKDLWRFPTVWLNCSYILIENESCYVFFFFFFFCALYSISYCLYFMIHHHLCQFDKDLIETKIYPKEMLRKICWVPIKNKKTALKISASLFLLLCPCCRTVLLKFSPTSQHLYGIHHCVSACIDVNPRGPQIKVLWLDMYQAVGSFFFFLFVFSVFTEQEFPLIVFCVFIIFFFCYRQPACVIFRT